MHGCLAPSVFILSTDEPSQLIENDSKGSATFQLATNEGLSAHCKKVYCISMLITRPGTTYTSRRLRDRPLMRLHVFATWGAKCHFSRLLVRNSKYKYTFNDKTRPRFRQYDRRNFHQQNYLDSCSEQLCVPLKQKSNVKISCWYLRSTNSLVNRLTYIRIDLSVEVNTSK